MDKLGGHPPTATSSGTRRPARRSATSAPSAITSDATNTASTSGRRSSSRDIARSPESCELAGAKPIVRYSDGPAAGGPAVTRYELGDGQAWYVSACTDAATTAALLAGACESAGLTGAHENTALENTALENTALENTVRPAAGSVWPPDLELVRRADEERRFVTLINHGESSADVMIGNRLVTVQAGDVTVIRT